MRCCGQYINMSIARAVLPSDKFSVLESRMEERLAEDKMYCPEPTCSVFMNLDNLSGEMKRAQPSSLCYACGTPICLVCKKTWHEGITCAQNKAEAESASIREMAQAEGWKLCPGCKNMVEKNEGCNHITCRCGKEFC